MDTPITQQNAPQVLFEVETALQKPQFYQVVLQNDDYTPMNFVIEILIQLFQKSDKDAYDIMMSVHNNGQATAGIYTREIAETKAQQVLMTAIANEFPLQCTIEPR